LFTNKYFLFYGAWDYGKNNLQQQKNQHMITQTKNQTAFRSINIPLEKNNVKEIVEAIKKMDIDVLDWLLDDKKTYQDFNKPEFLEMLNVVFEKLKFEGDTFLEAHKGHCASCNIGRPGFTFVGNHSRKYFDMVFEKNRHGIIHDMYECSMFLNKHENNFIKTECLYIDTDHGLFKDY